MAGVIKCSTCPVAADGTSTVACNPVAVLVTPGTSNVSVARILPV